MPTLLSLARLRTCRSAHKFRSGLRRAGWGKVTSDLGARPSTFGLRPSEGTLLSEGRRSKVEGRIASGFRIHAVLLGNRDELLLDVALAEGRTDSLDFGHFGVFERKTMARNVDVTIERSMHEVEAPRDLDLDETLATVRWRL